MDWFSLVPFGVFCLGALVFCWKPIRDWLAEKKYGTLGPISDEEYLKLSSCRNPNVALKVRNILADSMCLDPSRIRPQMSIMDLENL
jgi:hypothetical protein